MLRLKHMGKENALKPKVLAVIGARSGSKGILDKNIKLLLGKPLFTWVAEAAKKSKYISRLIFSSDSPAYAKIAREYGVDAPFLRPAEFAEDYSTDWEYLAHATKWVEENEKWKPDIILRLMPTSPLCQTAHIDACIELLLEDPIADAARTVHEVTHHPYKTWRIDGEYLYPAVPKQVTGFDMPAFLPRQAFPSCFAHGDPIAVRFNTLINKRSMGEKIRYHIILPNEAVDINDDIDFLLAKILLRKRIGGESSKSI